MWAMAAGAELVEVVRRDRPFCLVVASVCQAPGLVEGLFLGFLCGQDHWLVEVVGLDRS